MSPTIINERTYKDRGYIAFLNGKQIGLYAPSLAAAKQRAIEHFKPKKRDMGLLAVELAEDE